jgi:hypothetical protein
MEPVMHKPGYIRVKPWIYAEDLAGEPMDCRMDSWMIPWIFAG